MKKKNLMLKDIKLIFENHEKKQKELERYLVAYGVQHGSYIKSEVKNGSQKDYIKKLLCESEVKITKYKLEKYIKYIKQGVNVSDYLRLSEKAYVKNKRVRVILIIFLILQIASLIMVLIQNISYFNDKIPKVINYFFCFIIILSSIIPLTKFLNIGLQSEKLYKETKIKDVIGLLTAFALSYFALSKLN